MAQKTLNVGNLEALGAARLAELLMEISEGNAPAKRRLRLALAGAESPAEVAKEIRKRLATIARSRSFVDWQNQKSLGRRSGNAAPSDCRSCGASTRPPKHWT